MQVEQMIAYACASAPAAPRVTMADIEANIASEHYFTGEQGALMGMAPEKFQNMQTLGVMPGDIPESLKLLTFCVLVLRNGFTVTGESACASPENFKSDVGRKLARENAINKIWPLMGYELRTKLANLPPPAPHYTWGNVATHETFLNHSTGDLEYFVRLRDGSSFKGSVPAFPDRARNLAAIIADINEQAKGGSNAA